MLSGPGVQPVQAHGTGEDALVRGRGESTMTAVQCGRGAVRRPRGNRGRRPPASAGNCCGRWPPGSDGLHGNPPTSYTLCTGRRNLLQAAPAWLVSVSSGSRQYTVISRPHLIRNISLTSFPAEASPTVLSRRGATESWPVGPSGWRSSASRSRNSHRGNPDPSPSTSLAGPGRADPGGFVPKRLCGGYPEARKGPKRAFWKAMP